MLPAKVVVSEVHSPATKLNPVRNKQSVTRDVLGDPDREDEIADEDIESYAGVRFK